MIACGVCWALALGFTFERLITIDLVLWGMSIVLEFVALVILRRREPSLPRPFRIPGPDWVPIALAISPTALILYALHAARNDHVAGMPASVFALIIAGLGPPLYWCAKRCWRCLTAKGGIYETRRLVPCVPGQA